MPAYLCHGFRWHRKSIRYFVILQDIENAAPEWIVAPRSAEAILESFYNVYDFIPPCAESRAAQSMNALNALASGSDADMYKVNVDNGSDEERRGRRGDELLKYPRSLSASRQRSMSSSTTRLRKPIKRPDTLPVPPRPMQAPPPLFSPIPPESERNGPFNKWSSVKMLEEYDPSDEETMNGPWAYISDYAVRIDTSISPMDEMMTYEKRMKAEKFKAMSGSSDESGRKVDTMGNKNAGWLEKLRDKLQKEEAIKWYVVMCGDEERSFPLGNRDDDVFEGKKNEEPVKDEFQFRLPEFDHYSYARNSAIVQPLRLRKPERSPPPSTPPATPPSQQPQQPQSKIPMRSKSQSQIRARSQAPPRPQPPPPQRKYSFDKPPAVPAKEYTPPPDPLANLRDIGSRKPAVQLDMTQTSRKSTMNIRKLFSKKPAENFI